MRTLVEKILTPIYSFSMLILIPISLLGLFHVLNPRPEYMTLAFFIELVLVGIITLRYANDPKEKSIGIYFFMLFTTAILLLLWVNEVLKHR